MSQEPAGGGDFRDAPRNVVLIGMPGAGKSTLGVLLAKQLAKRFVDTDLLIQEQAGKTLQAILDQQGHLALRELEEQVLLDLDEQGTVIATGGSAVYSEAAMAALRQKGICVYLRLSLANVERRVHNASNRGIAVGANRSLADVYSERQPLYQRYADIVIDCDGKNVEQVLVELETAVHTAMETSA